MPKFSMFSGMLNAILRAGKPKGFGEGKQDDIEGMPEPGTIERVNKFKELEDLVKLYKLQAVESYKEKVRK